MATFAQKLPDIGVITSVDNIETVKLSGYDFLEPGVGDYLKLSEEEEVFGKFLDTFGQHEIPIIALVYFIPGRLKSVGQEADHQGILEYVALLFQRAQKAGVKYVVFGSGGSRAVPEGFSTERAREQFVALNKAIAQVAAKYQVVVLLEPLNKKECNFINSLAEAGSVVEDVNHPNFLLCADIYHMKTEGEGPESIIRYGHLIRHLHVAEKEGRSPPGTHGEDFSPYYRALKSTGFKGGISIEANWQDLAGQSVKAIQTIRDQWNK